MKNLIAKTAAKATIKMAQAKAKMMNALKDERGEVNLIAILLIIVVVVGLVIIFRESITTLINNIFKNINKEVEKV